MNRKQYGKVLILMCAVVVITATVFTAGTKAQDDCVKRGVCVGWCRLTCVCLPLVTSLTPSGGGNGEFDLRNGARDCGTCVKWGLPCFQNCGPGLAHLDWVLCPD